MTVDPSAVPGLLFLLAELVALAAVGYVIVRTALRETDDRVALAQGLVVGPAIWGVVVNLIMYALPGLAGAVAGWIFVLALAAVLIWRARGANSPAAADSGGIRSRGASALLGRARQPPALDGYRRVNTPGAGRIDPGWLVSARAALESGHAPSPTTGALIFYSGC